MKIKLDTHIRHISRMKRALCLGLSTAVLATMVGCQTTNGTSFTERMQSMVPKRQKSALKDPSKLYLAYAKWQEHSGNTNAARESYRLVLEQDARSVEATLGMARVNAASGAIAEADEGFRKALALAPENADVHAGVGEFLTQQNRPAEAITHLKRAMVLDPAQKNYSYHLGVAMAKQGDYRGALQQFTVSQGEAVAHYNVGYLMHQSGNAAGAMQQFNLALQADPNLTQARAMVANLQKQAEGNGIQLASHQSPATAPRPQQNRPSIPNRSAQQPRNWNYR